MMTRVFSCFVIAGLLTCSVRGADERLPGNGLRDVKDYLNADGRAPDGLDNGRDDSLAVQRALDAGPGIVQLGPGVYRFSNVAVPSRVILAGSGPGTTVRSSGGKQIIAQTRVDEWTVRDMLFDGEATGDWRSRTDQGRSAIAVDDCREFNLVGLTVRNFDGAGIQMTQTILEFHNSLPNSRTHLQRITASENYIGVRFDRRAEYMNATHLSCQFNVIGCVIHSGNVQIAASGFNSNVDGLVIEDKKNGSHGCITGCILNHNERYALLCRNVANSMVIEGCAIFYGASKLEHCVGVNLSSGMISCSIDSRNNTKANRIAGNFLIENPPGYTFEFSPSSIVSENFDADGLWRHNNR